MSVFQVSREKLLAECPSAGFPATRLVFSETKENEWVHGSARLLILVEGKMQGAYVHDGRNAEQIFDAPAAFFCTKDAIFRNNEGDSGHGMPSRVISFGYYPGYIRANYVDFDGVENPPTARDIYWHTHQPLSNGGAELVKTMELLASEGKTAQVAALCPVLYDLTLETLQASESSPVSNRALTLRLLAFLREHRAEPFSRNDVAHIFSISPGYVSWLCHQYTGESFSNLVLRYRLEHARKLLLESRFNVDEIAAQSGFSCANYFIRRFKKVYGITPHVYRNNPEAAKPNPKLPEPTERMPMELGIRN